VSTAAGPSLLRFFHVCTTRTAASQVFAASRAIPESGGKMELLIGFVTTLFISLLIFRT
jgi:hypothetical protein